MKSIKCGDILPKKSGHTSIGAKLGEAWLNGCWIPIHANSQELDDLLSALAVVGFPKERGIKIRGTLYEWVNRHHSRLVRSLPDDVLIELCSQGNFYRARMAYEELERRIAKGNMSDFHVLIAALQDNPGNHRLRDCFGAGIKPHEDLLTQMTKGELEGVLACSHDPIVTYAARSVIADERWKKTEAEEKQELAVQRAAAKKTADSNLRKIRKMNSKSVIDALNTKKFDDSRRSHRALIERLQEQTVGFHEIGMCFPIDGAKELKGYLIGQGIEPVGFVSFPFSRYFGWKYDRKAVSELIGDERLSKEADTATAYACNVLKARFIKGEKAIGSDGNASYRYARMLGARFVEGEHAVSQSTKLMYLYAKDVCKGRLPDYMHNKMVLSSHKGMQDTWIKKYCGTKKFME
jgi:hypothetical protein